jgi:hypothetical protein
MDEQAPAAAQATEPTPLENTAQAATIQWQKAERALAAIEANGGKSPPPPPPPPDPEKTPTEPAPPDKDEPEPAAAKDDDDKTEGNPKVAELHTLAKELGLKVDARGVTTEERYGFRQEKRKWQEGANKRDAEYKQRLEQTNAYFAPLHPAVEALKQGDIDGAVRALAKAVNDEEIATGGLNAANKRLLKRAAGEDPRIDELARWKAQREAEDSRRAQEAQEQAEQQRQQQERDRFVLAKAEEMKAYDDPYISKLALKPVFAAQVVAKMEQNWDGYETISTEEAARLVDKELRAAYAELHEVYGDPDPSNRETPGASQGAGRSGIATVGKKAPKALNARSASEASPPSRTTDAKSWRDKWAAKLAASSD